MRIRRRGGLKKANLLTARIDPTVTQPYPVSENGQDEFSRQECFQNSLNHSQVGREWNVTLKTDIGVFRLRSDVNSHVFTQAIVRGFVSEDPIHGVSAGLKEIIIDLHAWQDFVNARNLLKAQNIRKLMNGILILFPAFFEKKNKDMKRVIILYLGGFTTISAFFPGKNVHDTGI